MEPIIPVDNLPIDEAKKPEINFGSKMKTKKPGKKNTMSGFGGNISRKSKKGK